MRIAVGGVGGVTGRVTVGDRVAVVKGGVGRHIMKVVAEMFMDRPLSVSHHQQSGIY